MENDITDQDEFIYFLLHENMDEADAAVNMQIPFRMIIEHHPEFWK
jgi:hypothetical protein